MDPAACPLCNDMGILIHPTGVPAPCWGCAAAADRDVERLTAAPPVATPENAGTRFAAA